MFINNLNPDLLHIGPFTIRFYGIVYAAGFLLVSYLATIAAKKKLIKNLDEDKASNLVIVGMVAGIIGARIFHVIVDFSLYKDNIIDVFAVWKGGLAFYGGLAGGLLAVYLYCRKHKIETLKVLDIAAVPVPLIIAFGRIANYINSENLGYISQVPWCVIYEKIDSACRHPSQIYEALSLLFLFIIMLILSRNKRFRSKTGNLAYIFILGYGIARFTTDFWRINSLYFGLSIAQILSLVAIVSGAYFLYQNNMHTKMVRR